MKSCLYQTETKDKTETRTHSSNPNNVPQNDTRTLATSHRVEERHRDERRHRQRDERRHRHQDERRHRRKVRKTSNKLKLELDEEEANKSLYLCYLEQSGDCVAYVIRAVRLSDLLSSEKPSRLRQVGFKAGDHLPGSVGSGVMGSQILLAGGLRPNIPYGIGAHMLPSAVWHRNVYAFETDPNKQPRPSIRKLDATLQGAKLGPMMVELGGKLYALSYYLVGNPPSFEVFDPKMGSWSALPQPPFFQPLSEYFEYAPFSYAFTGTKMFVSHEQCPVFCFDVAHPDREWRLVPTMCQGGPFPFAGVSLVLDLPEPDKKIVFAYSHDRWCLGVYVMSLCENQESITRIGDLKLPRLPYELGEATGCDFVHIGGRKACIVVPELEPPCDDEGGDELELGSHKTLGVAIPFQFEVDMTKLDKDKKIASPSNSCLFASSNFIPLHPLFLTPNLWQRGLPMSPSDTFSFMVAKNNSQTPIILIGPGRITINSSHSLRRQTNRRR
ncbi:PREDICTED: uncharacterized protein LOC101313410 isoform X2 [Fragaria vesca subsp. vesca]|uniref:uncharacterized protein LOC101313410 isoform X2 n=1 Tax=Fragaria vesca subsp. vesca TaxID=101020 RepID=UPI0002C30FBD|nr:PREDICTED: uncharacterized protein LOC101313410 isoform X2 [Fragaria vesca subsp. vesca]